MAKSRFFPPDDVTGGEWQYLSTFFDPEDAEERRARIRMTLKRLVRSKVATPQQLHAAIMAGIKSETDHRIHKLQQPTLKKRAAAIAQARKDVGKALASLRRLIPKGAPTLDDDGVFRIRELLLAEEVPTVKGPRGRPWQSKQVMEAELKKLGVTASDRRELLGALGFLQDE